MTTWRRSSPRSASTAPVRADEVTASTNATRGELGGAGGPAMDPGHGRAPDGGKRPARARLVRRPRRLAPVLVVLRPELAPDRTGLLSLLAGAAMAEAAPGLAEVATCVQVAERPDPPRRQGGGVLLESRSPTTRSVVVVGVGVNLEPPRRPRVRRGIGDQRRTRACSVTFFAGSSTSTRGPPRLPAGPRLALAVPSRPGRAVRRPSTGAGSPAPPSTSTTRRACCLRPTRAQHGHVRGGRASAERLIPFARRGPRGTVPPCRSPDVC